MSLSAVQSALLGAIQGPLAGWQVAYPNIDFVIPDESEWARVSFVPNPPSVATLGDAGEDMVDGFLQIDLNYPLGVGDSESRAMFETLRQAFPAGTRVADAGQVATIISCGRSQGRLSDNWFVVSVTIGWYALIQR